MAKKRHTIDSAARKRRALRRARLAERFGKDKKEEAAPRPKAKKKADEAES
jgi:hypothetical protein